MLRVSIILTLIVLTTSPALAQGSDDAFQGFLDALQTSRELLLLEPCRTWAIPDRVLLAFSGVS